MIKGNDDSVYAGSSTLRVGLVSLALVLLSGGCATADLTQTEIVQAEQTPFTKIILKLDLADQDDFEPLTSRLIRNLDRYDLQVESTTEVTAAVVHAEPGTALLKIGEVERRIETVAYRRTYGRTSLTQMRGRKSRDVPVITLRTTFMDAATGQVLFQADYIAQGPWYADSASVVASVAGTLVKQLESNGFISIP